MNHKAKLTLHEERGIAQEVAKTVASGTTRRFPQRNRMSAIGVKATSVDWV
jgi:hypothetical protein